MRGNNNQNFYIIALCLVLVFFYLFIYSLFLLNEPNSLSLESNFNPKISANEDWYRIWGNDSNNEIAYGIDVHNTTGNIYIVGSQEIFGSDNIVLLKFNQSGGQEWNSTWDNGDNDYGYDIAISQSSGDVYATGTTQIGSDFQACLIRFGNSGNQIWNKTYGGVGLECGQGVAIDSLNNIYITGFNDSSNDDIITVKYDSLGNQQWNRTWDGGADEIGTDIAIDSDDNLYITGYTKSYGNNDQVVLIKYNSSGDQEWNRTWGGSNSDKGLGVAVDSNDNIYISGIDGNYYMVLLKYNSEGVKVWESKWGDENGNSYGEDICINSLDMIYVAIRKTDLADKLIAQNYSTSGTLLCESIWERAAPLARRTYCIASNPDGTIYLGGYEYNTTSGDYNIIFVKEPYFACFSEGNDDDSDDNGTPPFISFGNFHLVFLSIGIVLLIYKSIKKQRF